MNNIVPIFQCEAFYNKLGKEITFKPFYNSSERKYQYMGMLSKNKCWGFRYPFGTTGFHISTNDISLEDIELNRSIFAVNYYSKLTEVFPYRYDVLRDYEATVTFPQKDEYISFVNGSLYVNGNFIVNGLGNTFILLNFGRDPVTLKEFTNEDTITFEDLKIDKNGNNIKLEYKAKSLLINSSYLKHAISLNGGKYEAIKPSYNSDTNTFSYEFEVFGKNTVTLKAYHECCEGFSRVMFFNDDNAIIEPLTDGFNSIVIYDKNETDFTTNGLGVITDIYNAEVKEELNGNFTFEFSTSINNKMIEYYQIGNIVKVRVGDNRVRQLFKIKEVKKNSTKATIFAQHIALTELSNNYSMFEGTYEIDLYESLNILLDNSLFPHNFKIIGINDDKKLNITFSKGLIYDKFIKDSNDNLMTLFGKELELDNFNLKIHEKRGNANGIQFRDNKNILEIDTSIDDFDLCNVLIPISSDGIMLPEVSYIASNVQGNNYYLKENTFQDIKLDEVNNTTQKVQDALRKACEKMFEIEKINVPKISIKLSVKDLKSDNRYKHLDYIQQGIRVGDTVPCRHKTLNMTFEGRVISKTYNPVNDETCSIEIAFRKRGLDEVFGKKIIDNVVKNNHDLTTKQFVKENIDNVKAMIQSNSSSIMSNDLQLAEISVESDYRLSILELGL